TVPPNVNQDLTLPADFAVLQSAVVGDDLTQWVSLRTSSARLTLGFTDLIPVDGLGADLAVFEIGTPAQVNVTIRLTTHQYVSQPSSTPNVNLVLVDLADFGVSQAPSVTISSSDIFNDIAGAAAINAVPEPSSLALAALGLVAVIACRWL